MGDMGEVFRAMKDHQAAARARRYKRNMHYLSKLTGYVVTELTPYQHRIFGQEVGDFMDIYPTNQRYHNLITNERGHYKTIQGFVDLQYNLTKEKLKDSPNES